MSGGKGIRIVRATTIAAVLLAGCMVEVPALQRPHRVRTEMAVPDFTVVASPEGAVGWRVDIRNNTAAVATIIWDESTFVTANGTSAGRLIAGSTMKIDVTRAHPPTPVAPGANSSEVVIPEAFVEDEEIEDRAAKLRRENDGRMHKRDADIVLNSRRARDERIVGGKLYVTIQGINGKQMWAGVVSSTEKP